MTIHIVYAYPWPDMMLLRMQGFGTVWTAMRKSDAKSSSRRVSVMQAVEHNVRVMGIARIRRRKALERSLQPDRKPDNQKLNIFGGEGDVASFNSPST